MEASEEIDFGKYYDPKTNIISMPDDPDKNLDQNGTGHWLFNLMQNNLHSIVQVDIDTEEEQPTSIYLQKCIRAALEMRRLGISPGDIISICAYNQLDSSVPFVATQFLGAVSATLDPTLALDDITHLLSLVNPKLMFVSEESVELITKAKEQAKCDFKIVVFGKSEKNLEFSQFVQENSDENDFVPYKVKSIEETAIILFSSGTTGLPKGICLSHQFCMWHVQATPVTAYLMFSTLYWISSALATFLAIYKSLPKFISKRLEPEKLWQKVQKHKVNGLFLSPSDAIKVYRYIPKNYKSNLNGVVFGGSHIPNEYMIKYQEALTGTEIINGFAQTELGICFRPATLKEKLGSIGTPMNNRSYKIVNPETEEVLGFNEKGELRVKTKWCMNGYYNQDSTKNWDKDGFLKTGDICYFDKDFHFYIVDRIKEMFKYKSFHIVPAKLENIILQHPEIEMAAVIGIPHPEDDHHIMAVVQPMEGSQITPEEIKKFVEDKVDDRHKLRAGVKFLKKIPLTPSAKIKRQELKAIFIK